ncbi:MAG: preprotein translocase subunit SecF [candidate division Zixibacteria bacterium SM23_81]|nr:MAG: preprotein translocase subunit SecF [candidate division Zixibacteria bacterium SM23_81]
MQIFKDTHFDFVNKRKIAFLFSAALIVLGVISLAVHRGPSFSIDFAGGTLLQIQFENDLSVQEIRSALEKIGWADAEIQKFSQGNEFLIRVKKQEVGTMVGDQIKSALSQNFPDNEFQVRREEKVGPKIGEELKSKAVWAILYAMIGILIYISWRFEFKFAVGAIVALFHDVLITVGIFSLLNKEISLAIVAALLTIVGYSLNDTIVVFDRIREDLALMRSQTYEAIINASINQTLGRTVITSLTTFLVVVCLFTLGGEVIHDFAFALMIGVIVGTYSSIFVASPVLIEWHSRLLAKKK